MMLEYTVAESGRTRRGRCCCAEGRCLAAGRSRPRGCAPYWQRRRCTWMLPPPRVLDWLYPSSGTWIENVSAVPGSPWSATVTVKVTGVELAVAVPSILLLRTGRETLIPAVLTGQIVSWSLCARVTANVS